MSALGWWRRCEPHPGSRVCSQKAKALSGNYGAGPSDVVSKLQPLLDDADAQHALVILARDFSETDAVGPMRIAAFVTGGKDQQLQADAVGFIGQLLAKVKRSG